MALMLLVQDVEKQDVAFKSGEAELKAYLVKPKGDGPFPAVVVIHEWWGLNDQIKGIGEKLAREGFVALCVDLYRGKAAKSSDEAHELMRGLPEDQALKDLQAAFAFLKEHKNVKGKKIGSVGFCMGGSYSLSLATAEAGLGACAIFYGRLLTDEARLKAIRAPVIGFFGDQDRGIPVDSVRKFEKTLKDAGKTVEVQVYAGAGHAFMNETGKNHHSDSAKDAWKRLIDHFKANLAK